MEDRIYDTIARILAGEGSADDRQALQVWLQMDDANRATFAHLENLWRDADRLFAPQHRFDTDAAWHKVRSASLPAEAAAAPTRRAVSFPPPLRYAAGLAAILIIGFFGYRTFFADRHQVLFASAGNLRETLPDGTVITLHAGSTLRYPAHFGKGLREVSLEGEAFFEVARDEAHPFLIDAGAAEVKVLGTSFNVKCARDSAVVSVRTGRVQLNEAGAARALILTPGKEGRLRNGKLEERNSAAGEAYRYWQTGELSFTGIPLATVVGEIGRATGAMVTLDPGLPVEEREQAVTITFRNQPVGEMLTELGLITRLRWQKEGSGYVLKK